MKMKIGYLGADGHGKTTTMLAVMQYLRKDGDNICVPYHGDYEKFTEALKEPEIREFVLQCLRSGGRVDLGCDACMTPEGKKLTQIIRDLERRAESEG